MRFDPNKLPQPPNGDNWQPPKGFYEAYLQWMQDAEDAILAIEPTEEGKERFRRIHKRMSEDELLTTLRGLSPDKQADLVRKIMEGWDIGLLTSDFDEEKFLRRLGDFSDDA